MLWMPSSTCESKTQGLSGVGNRERRVRERRVRKETPRFVHVSSRSTIGDLSERGAPAWASEWRNPTLEARKEPQIENGWEWLVRPTMGAIQVPPLVGHHSPPSSCKRVCESKSARGEPVVRLELGK